MYILSKSTRFRLVVMMIKDRKHLIKLQRIHTEKNAFKTCESEMLSKYKRLILMIMQIKSKQNII